MKTLNEMLSDIQSLNEVKVRGRAREGSKVLAKGMNIYVWNSEREFDRLKTFINRELGTDFESEYDIDSWYLEGSNIVYGEIERGALRMPGDSSYKPSTSDATLRKVLNKLGLHSTNRSTNTITSNGEEFIDHEFETKRSEFNKKIAERTFYHGTCTTFIESMLKIGLKPGVGDTQFDNINHTDKVFITTELDKAMFHASHSASKNSSFPVIIELKIPDEAKLVSDYDVVIDILGADSDEAERLGYQDIFYQLPYIRGNGSKFDDDISSRFSKRVDKLSTRMGIFGYKGRIPSNFFTSIIADTEVIEDAIPNNYLNGNIDFEFNLSAMTTDEGSHRDFDYWNQTRPDRFISNLEDHYDEFIEEEEGEWD